MADIGLDTVVRKAMGKDPADRHPSVQHFKKSLRDHMRSMGPSIVEEDPGS